LKRESCCWLLLGTKVEGNGRRFLITHFLDLEAVLAKDEEAGRAERLFIKDLGPPKPEKITLPREGDSKVTIDVELVTVADQDSRSFVGCRQRPTARARW
jgi:hypothetical protein